jgi:hypothetical protein
MLLSCVCSRPRPLLIVLFMAASASVHAALFLVFCFQSFVILFFSMKNVLCTSYEN